MNGGEVGHEETRTIDQMIVESEAIMEKVTRFWQRQSIPQTANDKEAAINTMTNKLLRTVSEEHAAYNKAHPLLIMNFCRCIYDRDALMSYFNSIINNGGKMGDEDTQIKRIAKYCANARAAVFKKKGVPVSDASIKKEKNRLYKEMSEERRLMKKAIEEIQKERELEEESKRAGGGQEEKDSSCPELKNSIFDLFSTEGLENCNELFKESVRKMREEQKAGQKDECKKEE